MIRETLLPELQSRFPNRGLRAGESVNQICIFPATHSEVGDLQIWDDGDEATIYIGSITHGHFDSDDRTLSEADSARCITDEVVEFLELLFADRVVIHESRTDGSAGWEVFDSDDFSDARLNVTDRTYVWSGPIKNPKRNMADAPKTVTIVVDPAFGDRLYAVAKETPVWIVDTPINRVAAEVVRAQNAEQRHPSAVTTFQVERNSTPEEWCANILRAVDLHHGEYSHDPPYAVIEVIGAPLTTRLGQVFSEYDLNSFVERAAGFQASRSTPAG